MYDEISDETYLKDDTSFLEKIDFDISTSDFTRVTEVNTDEFTLENRSDEQKFSLICELTNRDELLLRVVFALPKASRTGFD